MLISTHNTLFASFGSNLLLVGMPAEYNEQLAHFAYWLATFHVPTFVLISGFIYSHIVNEKKGYSKPSEFLCKKVKRLLMPYFAITILWLIPFALVLSSYTFKEIIVKYVLVGGEQLWFLYMLFGVFLLFHFVVRNNKKIYEMLTVFGCYIIGLLLSFKGINYFQIASSLQYLLFFWIGYRLRIVMQYYC